MKKIPKILTLCLAVLSVISLTYQTSFGASQEVNFTKTEADSQEDQANVAAATAVVGLVAGVLGGAYAVGYALGRAYGNYVHGSQDQIAYNFILDKPTDFSSFDN